MDPKLSGEKLNEERAFIKRFTDGLASRPVEYPDDFSTPLADRPKKVMPVQVSLVLPRRHGVREADRVVGRSR